MIMNWKFLIAYIFCFTLGGIIAFLYVLSQQTSSVEPPVQKPAVSVVKPIEKQISQPLFDLHQEVSGQLQGSTGSYGVEVRKLNSNAIYSFNNERKFEAASLYKLWVMATAFKQIEEEKLKLTDILTADVDSLNREFSIASDEAELTEGTVSLSVKTAIEQMITISHNYAALLLSKRVGMDNVQKFLLDHHYFGSSTGIPPVTTAHDAAQFFEDLYRGKLATSESTQMMVEILKRQKINTKLPKKLPPDVQAAHKTGELGYFSHDAGIVYTPKGDYVIAVLSLTDLPDAANDRIADISKAVYQKVLSD